MAKCWGLDSTYSVGRVTDCERALERKVEVRSQERQVLSGCQEGAGSHDILFLRVGGGGRQTDSASDLVSGNLPTLIRGACPALLRRGSRVWLGQVTEGKPR